MACGPAATSHSPHPRSTLEATRSADSILAPTTFFGVKFSVSTNRTDLQTNTVVPPPTIVLRNGKLAANLASWAASWNKQNFNQGAPKPVQSTAAKSPGQAQAQRAWDWVSQRWLGAVPKASITGDGATGTIDVGTGRFTLEWTSLIKGGPFNGFTGIWHLEGVYQPSAQAPTARKMSLVLPDPMPAELDTLPVPVGARAAAAIVVEDATKVIEGVTVLDKVSFTVRPGPSPPSSAPTGRGNRRHSGRSWASTA